MLEADWRQINHFEAGEFNHPARMDYGFLQRLDLARSFAGTPFKITSDFRDDDDHSPHRTGKAVDIKAHHSLTKFRIVRGLLKAGFTRIGVYDKHVHADSDPQGRRYTPKTGLCRWATCKRHAAGAVRQLLRMQGRTRTPMGSPNDARIRNVARRKNGKCSCLVCDADILQ